MIKRLADRDSIDELPLNTRARNCLREEGIRTVYELREWADPSNFRQQRLVINMGPKTLAHIREVIRDL